MNLSEQKRIIETNPKLDAELIAIAGENLSWEILEYADDSLRFSIKPSILGDGEIVSVKRTNNSWEILSQTKMKVLTSFFKNWLNVKKLEEEILLLLEYDDLEKQKAQLVQEKFETITKPWYSEVPWLSAIIVLVHVYVFWMFNQEVRDDAWQAERWVLRDAGAFDRSLYYDQDWVHILKSFFFDFRPGILYVFCIAVLALGYTIERTIPRWFLLLILIVSGFTGMLWAFDRTPASIYDVSQSTFATLLGVYISALFTRAIYFPAQRVVALALFAYFGYWTMKVDYFIVVDKNVFLGSWFFGMLGGLCWYIPFHVAKIKKLVAPLALFLVYGFMSFWVYKTVNHDYLCLQNFKNMAEKIDPYIPSRGFDKERTQKQRILTQNALSTVEEQMEYKTTKSMWEVNIALKKFLNNLIATYDRKIKKSKSIEEDEVPESEPDIVVMDDVTVTTKSAVVSTFDDYIKAAQNYSEKEHTNITIINN